MGFKFFIDMDGSGDFTGDRDEITADVIQAGWALGLTPMSGWGPADSLSDQTHLVASDTMPLQLTVKNTGGKYNAGRPTSEFFGFMQAGRRVQVLYVDPETGGTATMFQGILKSATPQWSPGMHVGQTLMNMEADSIAYYLKGQKAAIPPQFNKTTGEIADALLSAVPLPPADGTAQFWRLGHLVNSVLGVTTRLYGLSYYTNISGTCQQTIASYYPEDTNVWDQLAELAFHEQGYLYAERSGKIAFVSRNDRFTIPANTGTVASSTYPFSPTSTFYQPTGLDYAYGANVLNGVTAIGMEVSQSIEGGVLWQLNGGIGGGPDESITLRLSYKDTQGRQVYSTGVQVGTATIHSGTPTFSVESYAAYADLTINFGAAGGTVTYLTLAGPYSYRENEVRYRAGGSVDVTLFGPSLEATYEFPLIDNLDDLTTLAQGVLNQYSALTHELYRVDFSRAADDIPTAALARWTMGTVLDCYFPEFGFNLTAPFRIIGEVHTWQVGGLHNVSYYLENRAAGNPF